MNLPLNIQQIIGPLLVALICSALFVFEPITNEWFVYDRSLIEQFEVWRLLSANFLHTNLNHLLLNIAGIALLWGLHGQYYNGFGYLSLIVFCSICCTLLLFLFAAELQWYVGLSGTLHGLFVVGAYLDIEQKMNSGWLLLIGIWIKIGFEQWQGPSAQVANLIDAQVAVDAHLFGAIAGLLAIVLLIVTKRPTNRD
jgi:rhomboid family GlyGly-CTERM serine protease